jgi:hypothetical protein
MGNGSSKRLHEFLMVAVRSGLRTVCRTYSLVYQKITPCKIPAVLSISTPNTGRCYRQSLNIHSQHRPLLSTAGFSQYPLPTQAAVIDSWTEDKCTGEWMTTITDALKVSSAAGSAVLTFLQTEVAINKLNLQLEANLNQARLNLQTGATITTKSEVYFFGPNF